MCVLLILLEHNILCSVVASNIIGLLDRYMIHTWVGLCLNVSCIYRFHCIS